ncbi:MAG: DNA polymerase III subunit alpha, partial [Actinobacteria bacterium]|nr:DNA polymerase III subunit alpha [Actinomycetota bacterium]
TLEDLEGAMEVLFFPSTYAECSTRIADDEIVFVKGRLDRRDDSPKLIALEVSVPDLSENGSGPFVVSMPVGRCVPPVVERLQEVLRGHPGLADVHLRLVNGRRVTVVKLDDKLRVKPSPSLHADLKQLLGPSCIS